jgi:hypothetical protein
MLTESPSLAFGKAAFRQSIDQGIFGFAAERAWIPSIPDFRFQIPDSMRLGLRIRNQESGHLLDSSAATENL